MDENFVITYLVDGRKFRMVFLCRKDISDSEILKEAKREMIEKGFDDFELLDWRWAKAVC